MARKLGSQCKLCRREGEKLYLKGDKCFSAKCPVSRRAYPPGQHGPGSRIRLTSYGTQLREKQKAKNTYGLMEKQFRGYFEKASRKTGNTAEQMIKLLESRLDNVVFRLGFTRSRATARQIVNHGLVLVNGKKVSIPSYQVKTGDVVTLTEKFKKSKAFGAETDRLQKVETPSWLHMDKSEATGKVLNLPEGEDLNQNFNPKLIVEFYSR